MTSLLGDRKWGGGGYQKKLRSNKSVREEKDMEKRKNDKTNKR